VWSSVRVLPAPPRSPAHLRFPGALGIVFNIPRLCCPETRDSTVSVARNGLTSPKMPPRSLTSLDFFPAEFPVADRDWFECRPRPVRVRRPDDLRNRRRLGTVGDLLARRRSRQDAERAANGGVGVNPVASSLHDGNDQHALPPIRTGVANSRTPDGYNPPNSLQALDQQPSGSL
jgi:hypothetical protein